MIKNYKKNLKTLEKNYVYSKSMEHDACGVGLIASTEGKKSRKVVEYGIKALKAVFHRGAVDADGKTGDGAGIHLEIPSDFFTEKIELTGHKHDNSEICIGILLRSQYLNVVGPKSLFFSTIFSILNNGKLPQKK